MSFSNPSSEVIRRILTESHSIAIVGLSNKPDRDSYHVAKALLSMGYKVIPVRPGVEKILDQPAFPDIASLPDVPDVVDVFRAPEYVPDIVDDCIAKGVKILWLQESVVNEEAAEKAVAAGMTVVMDRCIYKEWVRLKGGATP